MARDGRNFQRRERDVRGPRQSPISNACHVALSHPVTRRSIVEHSTVVQNLRSNHSDSMVDPLLTRRHVSNALDTGVGLLG